MITEKNKTKKFIAILSMTFLTQIYGQITNPAPFCLPPFELHYNMMESIKINGQIHTFGPLGSFTNQNTYLFYNNVSFPALLAGGNASFEIKFYSPSDVESRYFGIWIDLNHSNTFEPNELLIQNSNTTMALLPVGSTPSTPIIKSINIPSSALTGTTRMRIIRGADDASPFGAYSPTYTINPCTGSNIWASCVYDFNINITGSTANIQENTESSINIFPNPAMNKLTVEGIPNSATYTVYNIAGKAIDKGEFHGSINTENYENGTYILQFSTDKNNIISTRFSKI